MSYLGLDIGTSGCKAVAFTREGKMLASAYREYPLIHPAPEHAELDSDVVIKHCFDVIREVNSAISEPVSAMSISTQGEAFTALDKEGKSLCNAMVSSDNRAVKEVEEFEKEFGKEKLYNITGHTSHPIFSLFKLLWIKKHKPEIWKNTKYFLCFEDLFLFGIGLKPHISWPLAGRTMLFDVTRHEWSKEILSSIGLDAERLAIPVATGTITGSIPAKTATMLGFTKEVIMVAGGHDQTVGALGTGVTEPGACMYATGTVECFCPMFDKLTLDPRLMKNNLCCYDFTVAGKYTTVAYSLTGGNILKWFRDEFGQQEKLEATQSGKDVYTLLLKQMPSAPTDLLVLPYFSPTGTPHFDTQASGAILGLKLTTRRGEILKALLEGVALEMRLNLELMEQSGMQIKSFAATGGGTRNETWVQMKADILNRPIKVMGISETGCYGAAMIAQSASEKIPVTEIIKKNETCTKTFHPDPENAKRYSEKYSVYKELYRGLKPFISKEQ
jgi:xylulokinase